MKLIATISCVLFELSFFVRSENILLICTFPSKSHHILFEEIAKALVKRGHHVTMIAPFRVEEKLLNYKEICVEEILKWKKGK